MFPFPRAVIRTFFACFNQKHRKQIETSLPDLAPQKDNSI